VTTQDSLLAGTLDPLVWIVNRLKVVIEPY